MDPYWEFFLFVSGWLSKNVTDKIERRESIFTFDYSAFPHQSKLFNYVLRNVELNKNKVLTDSPKSEFRQVCVRVCLCDLF